MGTFYLVTGILLGVSLGLGLALRVTVTLIMKSNDIGDSSGTCADFGRGVVFWGKKDKMREKAANKYYENVRK